jgi:hypothetical protein
MRPPRFPHNRTIVLGYPGVFPGLHKGDLII